MRRLSDLRACVWRKIGVVNAALERAPLWLAEERAANGFSELWL